MSSTHSARCGTRPLIHLPHSPYCFQLQGLFITAPGTLWNSSTLPPGSNVSPCFLISSGL